MREDIELRNPSGNTLKCSHFQPIEDERMSEKMPCVIYLHGNSSSRVEGLSAAKILLPMDMTVFCFDFSGCGKSEGDWVTLGYKEQLDLQTVINHLRSTFRVSVIGLWGRSMGAVTSLFYSAK
jgi:alpha/beta superfamily hydrolase